MKIVVEGATRAERAAALATQLAGLFEGAAEVSPTVGGRAEGLRRLAAFDMQRYARGRSYVVDGTVSQLAPYLRHGCLTLAEVRDEVLSRVGPRVGYKFINELAWRYFWRLVYRHMGRRIDRDLEPAIHDRPRSYNLPQDIAQAATGLTCIDRSLRTLYDTGYLHNHARMWVASYTIHHRGLHWSIGARLFEAHLLCGDPASNRLSWQWVNSSFSHKPYIFNKENVHTYTRGQYCPTCPARDTCPFDAAYPELWRRLFGSEMPA